MSPGSLLGCSRCLSHTTTFSSVLTSEGARRGFLGASIEPSGASASGDFRVLGVGCSGSKLSWVAWFLGFQDQGGFFSPFWVEGAPFLLVLFGEMVAMCVCISPLLPLGSDFQVISVDSLVCMACLLI